MFCAREASVQEYRGAEIDTAWPAAHSIRRRVGTNSERTLGLAVRLSSIQP